MKKVKKYRCVNMNTNEPIGIYFNVFSEKPRILAAAESILGHPSEHQGDFQIEVEKDNKWIKTKYKILRPIRE